ncbi:MAG TPA: L-ribulose-5-phosphate 4-epimerase AraD [Gemmatimonadaceae bacterium]
MSPRERRGPGSRASGAGSAADVPLRVAGRAPRALREAVCEANVELFRRGLAHFTFGNASGIDRGRGLIAIKPSGVPYDELTPASMVVTDMDGNVVEGDLSPSSDLPAHGALYRAFADVGGVVHTHSIFATAFAQARRAIPCLGTTHADVFHGEVPVTRPLTRAEIASSYELNTGRSIVRRFRALDPNAIPAVLVANHASFCWGPTVGAAVENASYLEEVATIAYCTLLINPRAGAISQALLDRHYQRKHGSRATYGQR